MGFLIFRVFKELSLLPIYDVDENPKAYYFQQAQNGLYARQAIRCDVLGITLDDVIAVSYTHLDVYKRQPQIRL